MNVVGGVGVGCGRSISIKCEFEQVRCKCGFVNTRILPIGLGLVRWVPKVLSTDSNGGHIHV